MRVLVVDDDSELSELLGRALERDGHVVSFALRIEDAKKRLLDGLDLLVLDIGLPDGSGLAFCEEIRASGNAVPILVLTAQSAVAHRVEGLDAGADDYLTKPFAIAELRARVRALARRRDRIAISVVDVGAARLDLGRRRATRGGGEIELTTREWGIVEALAARHGRVVARETILEEVWGSSTSSGAGSLEVLVARIRRKLGRQVIRTERGIGYALG
ncbi:MAG: response regulator transcription factor [Deltaproteobacteria bacterium]|jgi:two-component system OmpR family response regulator